MSQGWSVWPMPHSRGDSMTLLRQVYTEWHSGGRQRGLGVWHAQASSSPSLLSFLPSLITHSGKPTAMSLRHWDSPGHRPSTQQPMENWGLQTPMWLSLEADPSTMLSWDDCNPDQQLDCNLTTDLKPERSRFHPTKPSRFLTLGNYKIINVSCLNC